MANKGPQYNDDRQAANLRNSLLQNNPSRKNACKYKYNPLMIDNKVLNDRHRYRRTEGPAVAAPTLTGRPSQEYQRYMKPGMRTSFAHHNLQPPGQSKIRHSDCNRRRQVSLLIDLQKAQLPHTRPLSIAQPSLSHLVVHHGGHHLGETSPPLGDHHGLSLKISVGKTT